MKLPLLIYMFFILGIFGCGSNDYDAYLLSNHASDVEQTRIFWEDNAFWCDGTFPSKRFDNGDCDDGDMTLFNGLLCASGDGRGCKAVADAQDDEGRWWRSPRRRNGIGRRSHNSFSRDMAMGVLLYLIKTGDRVRGAKWLNWMNRNRPCLLRKPGGGCLVRGPHRLCRNEIKQACTVTPTLWLNIALVWQNLGLSLNKHMQSSLTDLARHTLIREARSTSPGYALHLKGVMSFMLGLIGREKNLSDDLNEVLYNKQPNNLFFRYLKNGSDQQLHKDLLSLCPDQNRFGGRLHQWSWERDTEEQAWLSSMLWDCIFLENIL